MARQIRLKPPNYTTPDAQASVPTPSTSVPSDHALHLLQSDCSKFFRETGRELGAMNAEIANLKTASTNVSKDVSDLTKLAHLLRGIVIGAGVLLAVSASLVWYFAGSKIGTLLKIADERQVYDSDREKGAQALNAAQDDDNQQGKKAK